MANPENSSSATPKCPQCGAELPSGVPPDLCPKCLLKRGMDPQPGPEPRQTIKVSSAHVASPGVPQPGEQLGHYRIIRPLGGGGMGTVFEAEDLESGRRIALKVLNHALDSPEARQRFFREGRLAASINHPNSVYVFGTEEIGGTPAIAMELVPGGTLEDRVRRQGPLPPAEAVDAILQIIAGLEAAQRVGILHRDIKPSNCFIDLDGTVKVGDFGLSISTAIRTEPSLTVTGAFLGTPAFSSPEQLRGEELNMRSDIYSVGATLFCLLTGRTPFQAKNVVALIATVFEHPAPSPKDFCPGIPVGLAKAVCRCLQKQPDQRFKDYAELGQALAPYSSAAPLPARLSLRFLAGVLDTAFLSLLSMTALLAWSRNPGDWLKLTTQNSAKAWALFLTTTCGSVLYYALSEGFRGTTVGKALCRLRVAGPDRNVPGFRRALVRALIYVLVPILPVWILSGGNSTASVHGSNAATAAIQSTFYVVLALLFCTMRRRNGFAALHDLLSKTRVTASVKLSVRPVLSASEPPPPAAENRAVIGPYHVLETLERSADGSWLLGYDLRLLRKVWIHLVPPGTPPVPPPLRNLGRSARLRWLTGRRSANQNWDVFEAVSGKPLARLIRDPQPWSQVRYWLHDIADEISAAEKDGTLPPVLALDRVWINADGRAKLLDFPAPGLGAASSPQPATPAPQPADGPDKAPGNAPPVLPEKAAVQRFLAEIATAALAGNSEATVKPAGEIAVPLPLHAREFLKALPRLLNTDAIAPALKPLLQRPAVMTRSRRATIIAGCLAFPALAFCVAALLLPLMPQPDRSDPAVLRLSRVLQLRSLVRFGSTAQEMPTDRQFALYVTTHYRAVITNQAAWSNHFALRLIKGQERQFAEQSLAQHPAPTKEEADEADAALGPYLIGPDGSDFSENVSFPVLTAHLALMFCVCLPALLAALLFRGGLVLRIAEVSFVCQKGAPASRLRLFWRALVAWSPVGLATFLYVAMGPRHSLAFAALAYGLACGLAILSVVLPERGLPDRLAGTWPVPR